MLLAQNTQAADRVYHGGVGEAICGWVSRQLLPTSQPVRGYLPVFVEIGFALIPPKISFSQNT
jgi:hypothetical protein